MKITLLGTGTSQGIPVISCGCDTCLSIDPKDKRLRCSVLIETKDKNIVIDTGPDFRQQMLRIDNKKLDAVLITHEHNDHLIGLDDIRPYNFIQKKTIDVYALHRVTREIKTKFAYAFNNPYPGAPRINLNEIKPFGNFKIGDTLIVPLPITHGKLEILGFLINNFAYITDASFVSEKVVARIKNIDVLVINALRNEKHPSHFSLDDALDFIRKVNPKKAYITHISHHFRPQNEWVNDLPKNVSLAYDKLILKI